MNNKVLYGDSQFEGQEVTLGDISTGAQVVATGCAVAGLLPCAAVAGGVSTVAAIGQTGVDAYNGNINGGNLAPYVVGQVTRRLFAPFPADTTNRALQTFENAVNLSTDLTIRAGSGN